MTIELQMLISDKEFEYLEKICKEKDLTSTQAMRLALRIYQLVQNDVYILNPNHPVNEVHGCSGD